MDVQDLTFHEPAAAARSNHFLLLQRSIRGLIIGKSDFGKTTLLNNLLDGWTTIAYTSSENCSTNPSTSCCYPRSPLRRGPVPPLSGRLNALKSNGIQPFFVEHGEDVPEPRELDPYHKNLIVLDDLMLSKQNTCEDYYVRGRHKIGRASCRERV